MLRGKKKSRGAAIGEVPFFRVLFFFFIFLLSRLFVFFSLKEKMCADWKSRETAAAQGSRDAGSFFFLLWCWPSGPFGMATGHFSNDTCTRLDF